jgi:hypothetical protein
MLISCVPRHGKDAPIVNHGKVFFVYLPMQNILGAPSFCLVKAGVIF